MLGARSDKSMEKHMLKQVEVKPLPKYVSNHFESNPPKADSVFLSKSTKELFLINDGVAYRRYEVALGRDPIGAKLYEGDNRTPEGEYEIDYRKHDSAYHLALHIDYPREEDRERATRYGFESAGSFIMIHGAPNNLKSMSDFFSPVDFEKGDEWMRSIIQNFDWTRGCIAVKNEEMEELFKLIDDGTPIWIQK